MSCQPEGDDQQTTTLNDVLKTEKSEAGQLQSLPSPFLPSEEDSSLSNGTLDWVTGGGDSKKDTKLGAGIGAAVGVGVGGLIGSPIAKTCEFACKKRIAVLASMLGVGAVGTLVGAMAGDIKDKKRASKRT